jgi:hypothetical protein
LPDQPGLEVHRQIRRANALVPVICVAPGMLAKTIHPYPTQAEPIKKVGDAYNRTRLTPFV